MICKDCKGTGRVRTIFKRGVCKTCGGSGTLYDPTPDIEEYDSILETIAGVAAINFALEADIPAIEDNPEFIPGGGDFGGAGASGAFEPVSDLTLDTDTQSSDFDSGSSKSEGGDF